MKRQIAVGALWMAAQGIAGCAHVAPVEDPALPAMTAPAPAALSEDHFRSDRIGTLGEEALRAILESPVRLDESQRIGVLSVAGSYKPERCVPVAGVPAELARALEGTGFFQAASEVTTDWPADGDIPGLRELAARYRSGYLLLYRQRFVDDDYANAWAFLYPTIVGAIVAPSRTLETAGVLEATLFDVRSGTILFTVYERVRGRSDETPFDDERKLRAMKARLLEQASGKLADQVVSKVRRLAASARAKEHPASAAAPNS
ncbi:MAG TPA: hypothetical protein VI356_07340 [Myxococcales bacterium]